MSILALEILIYIIIFILFGAIIFKSKWFERKEEKIIISSSLSIICITIITLIGMPIIQSNTSILSQTENVVESHLLVSIDIAQNIKGVNSQPKSKITGDKVYRYYYRDEKFSVVQGAVPANKTIIIFCDESRRIEKIEKDVVKNVELGFLHEQYAEWDYYYKIFIPNGLSIEDLFLTKKGATGRLFSSYNSVCKSIETIDFLAKVCYN